MAKKKQAKKVIKSVNGKSVEDWDKEWVRVPRGFLDLQSELRNEIGIFAAKRNGIVKYVGVAAQSNNGGLRAGLARARLKEQSGNDSYGMAQVRANLESVEAYIICTKDPDSRVQDAKDLGKAMIAYHKPEWNAPKSVVAAARKANYETRSS
jgi:hypothetical protein